MPLQSLSLIIGPPEAYQRISPEGQERATIIVACSRVLGVGLVLLGLLRFAIEPWGSCISMVIGVSLLLVQRYLQQTGQVERAATALMFFLLGISANGILIRGGINTPVAFATTILPWVAIRVCSRRYAIGWTAIVMFELFLFGGLEVSGALPLDPLNAQQSTQFTLQAIVAITIALATVGLLTEHFRLSNIAELKAQAQKVKSAEKTAGHLALQSRLTRLEAMASVGRLASGTAHEVNNPLAYIMGNLELVIRDMSTDPLHNAESLGALQDALAGAHTIQNVVKDLSTFSRTDEELTAVDLQPVLDSACKMANNQLRHRAVLRKEYAHTPLVVGIESRIGQVFLNLLINAAQAIPPGNAQDNIITIRTYVPNNDLVCVEVSDTGDGIPAEELSLVTQPFFTTKPGDMGAGLGLAVCENILHSLGGRLEIESQENEGTKVTVHLPVATVENTDTPVIPTSLPSQWTEKSGNQPLPALRILVIDDNTLVTRVLQRALMDHDVMIRNDGRLALEELHAAAHFDLILCDLMMPNVTGFNLFEHVRTTCPHLLSSFVFITGGAFTQGAQEFVQSTSALILHKPINLNALRALIEQRCQIKHIQETLSTAH